MSFPALPDVFGNYALRGFEEIVPPDPVSWLPVTLGWRIVLVILLARFSWSAFKYSRKWWHDRYRRSALRKLEHIFTSDSVSSARLRSVAELLKATALHAYPRDEVAALSGTAWIGWLNQHAKEPLFDNELRNLLTTTLYRSEGNIDAAQLDQLRTAAAHWISQHPGAADA